MTDITPDQHISGTTAGQPWSVTRYGTLVVTTIDGHSDDAELATEADAVAEYADQVAVLTTPAR